MNTDSNYRVIRQMVPELAKLLPDWLWFVLWPQNNKGNDKWGYQDDGFFRTPNVHPIPWAYDTRMRTSVLNWDSDRFRFIDTVLAPTIYWMHQVESAAQVSGGYVDSIAEASRPVIVSQMHYPIHRSLPYDFDSMFSRLWPQMGGLLASNRITTNSEYCLQMMKEAYSEFLSPKKLQEIVDKTDVIRFGFVDQKVFDTPISEGPGKPVFIYNHRSENYKRIDITADVLRQLRQKHNFEVWATQYVDQKLKGFPVDRIVGDPDYDVYLRNIAVPGINTLNSVHETFCISALDSLSLGHLLVAPDKLTFPELIPKDYPWLFKNRVEQTEMLDHILSTWPAEWEKWSLILRRHAREEFSLERYIQKYRDVLVESSDGWKKSNAKEHVRQSLTSYFGTLRKGKHTLKRICVDIQKVANLGFQAMPLRRVLREAGSLGDMRPIFDGKEIIIEWRGSKR